MKAANVVFQREAQEDVDAIARYIAGDNPEDAERFFVALDDLCELLAHAPDIGNARIFQSPRLHGVRIMPIRKFGKYLVFYRLQSGHIEIIHGARGYPSFFKNRIV